jgi:hypothetical protein
MANNSKDSPVDDVVDLAGESVTNSKLWFPYSVSEASMNGFLTVGGLVTQEGDIHGHVLVGGAIHFDANSYSGEFNIGRCQMPKLKEFGWTGGENERTRQAHDEFQVLIGAVVSSLATSFKQDLVISATDQRVIFRSKWHLELWLAEASWGNVVNRLYEGMPSQVRNDRFEAYSCWSFGDELTAQMVDERVEIACIPPQKSQGNQTRIKANQVFAAELMLALGWNPDFTPWAMKYVGTFMDQSGIIKADAALAFALTLSNNPYNIREDMRARMIQLVNLLYSTQQVLFATRDEDWFYDSTYSMAAPGLGDKQLSQWLDLAVSQSWRVEQVHSTAFTNTIPIKIIPIATLNTLIEDHREDGIDVPKVRLTRITFPASGMGTRQTVKIVKSIMNINYAQQDQAIMLNKLTGERIGSIPQEDTTFTIVSVMPSEILQCPVSSKQGVRLEQRYWPIKFENYASYSYSQSIMKVFPDVPSTIRPLVNIRSVTGPNGYVIDTYSLRAQSNTPEMTPMQKFENLIQVAIAPEHVKTPPEGETGPLTEGNIKNKVEDTPVKPIQKDNLQEQKDQNTKTAKDIKTAQKIAEQVLDKVGGDTNV